MGPGVGGGGISECIVSIDINFFERMVESDRHWQI